MMKKRLKQIALLALAVLAVVLIHNRVQQEAEEAALEAEGTARVEFDDADEQSMSVIRLGEDITLGRVEENTEDGGIIVTVPLADGTEKVYTFHDVAIDSWYVDAVNFVVSASLMKGMGQEPIFHPEYGILREELSSILYRYTHGEPVEPRYQFDDVTPDNWYYDSVAWVTNQRLMLGLEPNLFGVGEYMTCEQALIAIYRLAGEPQTDGSLLDYPYAAKVSDSARSAVDWAWKNGLITEKECVWYPPQAISRAQVALLLTRFSTMSK